MSQLAFPSSPHVEILLIVLQLFQVLFLWLHDWIPLGRLNDVTAVSSQDTSSVPATAGALRKAGGHSRGILVPGVCSDLLALPASRLSSGLKIPLPAMH